MGNETLISHIEKHLRHINDRKTGGFEWDKNNAEVYRIALAALTLEARTVSVKLPSLNPKMFNDDVMFGYRKAQKEAVKLCAAAGIKLEVVE
ncbi:hypothetical protein [Klebsiella michiganensis]|uniref:hypothetical protein n=1 Tax=Klebsiella michiganensis TaxID=1134687 RepID=UPI0016629D2B|nr:hypothetical protein [Klebsiella michiganensis]MBD0980799.1 hypothetical protein [Klebsiella michiganensis]